MFKWFIPVCLTLVLWQTAEGALVNSEHDFSALGGSPCGYCHSVHHSVGGTSLMNSDFGTFPAITKVYTSATRKMPIDINVVNTTDARLCLACHDQNTVTTLATQTTGMANVKQKLDQRNDPGIYINTDLSNDHPVGFVFDVSKDSKGIKTPTYTNVNFGLLRNQMWCSSCHNVHDNQHGAFLVMSNVGSALCFDCHIK